MEPFPPPPLSSPPRHGINAAVRRREQLRRRGAVCPEPAASTGRDSRWRWPGPAVHRRSGARGSAQARAAARIDLRPLVRRPRSVTGRPRARTPSMPRRRRRPGIGPACGLPGGARQPKRAPYGGGRQAGPPAPRSTPAVLATCTARSGASANPSPPPSPPHASSPWRAMTAPGSGAAPRMSPSPAVASPPLHRRPARRDGAAHRSDQMRAPPSCPPGRAGSSGRMPACRLGTGRGRARARAWGRARGSGHAKGRARPARRGRPRRMRFEGPAGPARARGGRQKRPIEQRCECAAPAQAAMNRITDFKLREDLYQIVS